MDSAKKQKAEEIVNSFLGNEEENECLLRNKRLLRYSPNVEFFTNSSGEFLVAIVKSASGKPKNNPVYRITDLRLILILESFAETTGGFLVFYKVPNK